MIPNTLKVNVEMLSKGSKAHVGGFKSVALRQCPLHIIPRYMLYCGNWCVMILLRLGLCQRPCRVIMMFW